MSEQLVAANKVQAARLKQPPVKRLLVAQLLIVVVVFLVVMVGFDMTAAKSAAIGALIAAIPNAYFTHWAFRYSGASATTRVTQAFYRGEAGKFLLTSLLFAGTFILVDPLNVVVTFLVYTVMLALNWILALCFLRR